MKKFIGWIAMRNLNMPQKIIIAYVFLFAVPIAVISSVTYRNYALSIRNSMTAYVSQIAGETMAKLDGYIADMEATTLPPFYIVDMQAKLKTAGNNPEKVRLMSHYIQLMNRTWNSKYMIYVFDSFGNVYYNMVISKARSNIDSLYEFFKELAYDANGSAVVLSTRQVTDMAGRTRYYLTVVRCIKDIWSFAKVGVVVIDLDIGALDNTVQALDSNTKGKTIILDADNNIVYSSDKTLLATKYTDTEVIQNATGGSGSFEMMRDGQSHIGIYTNSDATGMKLIVTIPVDTLLRDASATRRIVVFMSLATGSIALLFFMFLSYNITKPLRKLMRLMKKVEDGDLDVQFHARYRDEVGHVALSFNHMVARLKELINEVYVIKLREKQTELDALQEQINPHFIYNTLETIRMIATIHREDEISELIVIFGKLLRYSINQVNELVTIQDELQHLENYVFLQNKRFSNKFTLRVNVRDSHKKMKSIKLMFQPIVENSILHGLEQREEGGSISIVSEQGHNCVVFTVTDDGCGMDAENLREINQRLEGSDEKLRSDRYIGLRNVNERIKLTYGDQYGLAVNSQIGIGTEVVIRLPIEPPQ